MVIFFYINKGNIKDISLNYIDFIKILFSIMWSAVNSLFLAKFLLNYTLLLYDMLYKVLRPILFSMFSNSVHDAFANTFFN